MIFNEILRLSVICSFFIISMCNQEDDCNRCESTPSKDLLDSTHKPCGQYGIRCIDEKSYEVCSIPDPEDGSTDKPIVRECRQGYTCDEDNPAYCTPIDTRLSTTKTPDSETQNPLIAEAQNDYEYLDSYYYFEENKPEAHISRAVRSECTPEPECPTTTAPTTTSTASNYYTTINLKDAEKPPYDCDSFGFFPDEFNNTFFWYCDVQDSGEGYVVRHMVCGRDRVFDSAAHLCILKGTTRRVRTKLECDSRFTCRGKTAGKYPDEKDVKLYHLCLSSKYSPIKELLFSCPENMIFDPQCKKCKPVAKKPTLTHTPPTPPPLTEPPPPLTEPPSKEKETNGCDKKNNCYDLRAHTECKTKINCPDPMRFRSLDDCSGYFMCYQDTVSYMACPDAYKFDDNTHECLPENFVDCQEVPN